MISVKLAEDFIQRWGTHYIKSSKFGGQLQIRKFMDANDVSSKKEFAVEMEMEYKTLFSSGSEVKHLRRRILEEPVQNHFYNRHSLGGKP